MKKILFGITSLSLGGAERVLVDLANELSKDYKVTIFTLYAKGELEKQLNNKVKLKTYQESPYTELTGLQKLLMVLKVLFLRKAIYKKYIKEDYNVEIAFLEGPITRLFSTKNSNTKKIAWVHNDISKVFGTGIKAKLKQKVDKKIYEKFAKLVFVSKDNLESFEKIYVTNKNQEKQVIYNYLNAENIIKKAEEQIKENLEENQINFVSVARLVKQKGIERLLKVHKKLIEEGLSHVFYIIGDGEEKEKLEKLVQENKLENTFKLLGKRENPYPYIKKADYFCLFSEFEGYGMVIEEAKILNKPILITDTAAREAVQNYENSTIAENSEDGIYKVLKEILTTTKEEKQEKNEKQYENKEIIEEIIDLIEK